MARFTMYIQTCLPTNGVVASYVNIDCWMNKKESYSLCRIYVTAKKSFPWAGKKTPRVQIFCEKYNYSLLSATTLTTCKNLICYKTGSNLSGKTCNIIFQLVLQQSFKTSCTELLPVFVYLSHNRNSKAIHVFALTKVEMASKPFQFDAVSRLFSAKYLSEKQMLPRIFYYLRTAKNFLGDRSVHF